MKYFIIILFTAVAIILTGMLQSVTGQPSMPSSPAQSPVSGSLLIFFSVLAGAFGYKMLRKK